MLIDLKGTYKHSAPMEPIDPLADCNAGTPPGGTAARAPVASHIEAVALASDDLS